MLPLKITPVGGMKEIGANCFLYETEQGSILIDCGVHPGYDFDPHEIWDRFTFLKAKNVKAIVITHPHQDHIGAAIIVANMLNVPVYTSKFGYLFLKAWKNSAYAEKIEDMVLPEVVIFEDRDVLNIGDFEITAFELAHSVPETFGFLIKAGSKKICHMGDFKLTGYGENSYNKNVALLAELGKEGIDLLITETLNIKYPGVTPPEKIAVNTLIGLISENPGKKHFIFSFSTNIRRIVNLWMHLFYEHNIPSIFRGSAMHRTAHILAEHTGKNLKHTFKIPDSNTVVLFCTGCQGEPKSFIERLAMKESMPRISKGDVVYLSSVLIPNEDKSIFDANKNRLRKRLQELHTQGAKIVVATGQASVLDIREFAQEEEIHVSGHECREGIATIIKLLNPAMLLPYHCLEDSIKLVKILAAEISNDIIVLETNNNETIRI